MSLPIPATAVVDFSRRLETYTADARGNRIHDWGDPVSTEAHVYPIKVDLVMEGGRMVRVDGFAVIVPPDFDVKVRDRVTWGGEDFRVQTVRPHDLPWGRHHLRVDIVKAGTAGAV